MMGKNTRGLVMGILALASIGIGGVVAVMLSRGCARNKPVFPVQEVPETVEPDFIFSAPETLAQGGVKSVRKSFPDGSDRLVYYYEMVQKKKALIGIREYYDKGIQKRDTAFYVQKKALIIEDRAWYPNGFIHLNTRRKAEPVPDGSDYAQDTGVLHGTCAEYWQNGVCFTQGRYEDGKREGMWHEWNRQGVRVLSAEYSNGMLNGIYRKWNITGAPLVEGSYRNGKKAGTWVFYKQDGSPPVTETFPDTGKNT